MTPSLSIIIPWCNRPELEFALERNFGCSVPRRTEVIVVNCGGDSDALHQLLSRYAGNQLRHMDVPAPFSRSLAINLGVSSSRSDVVFTLDADVLIEPEVLAQACESVMEDTFVTIGSVAESRPVSCAWSAQYGTSSLQRIVRSTCTEFIWADGRTTKIENIRYEFPLGSRSGPGLMLVRKDSFVAVDGYCSDLRGWGFEDLDMQVRLQKVLHLKHCQTGTVLHLSHGDSVRDLHGRSREANTFSNFDLACRHYAQGYFAGTYSRDVDQWCGSVIERTQEHSCS